MVVVNGIIRYDGGATQIKITIKPQFYIFVGPSKWCKIWETLFLRAFGQNHTKKACKIMENTKCGKVNSEFYCIYICMY
jgi:hypothetical protein